MKPSTMRSTTGMALFGHFTTAPRSEITRTSMVIARPREAARPTPTAATAATATVPSESESGSESVTERISPGPSRPVFVDASGRRGRLFRPLGLTLDCILAIPIILGGVALATDVGLPSVPWPASAGSGSTSSGGTSGSTRTSVPPVSTPSTTGTRAVTVRSSSTNTTDTTDTTSSAGGSTPLPAPTATPTAPTAPEAPAGRQGHG